jgi:hypothetical protein
MKHLLLVIFLVILSTIILFSQELPSDAHSLLLLHCNNKVTGQQGEAPLTSSGIAYEKGVYNEGVFLGKNSNLSFSSKNNIYAFTGTVELWIKPKWDGNDNNTYVILDYGAAGGIYIYKDSTNNLKLVLNRLNGSGGAEMSAAYDIKDWKANEWHFVAFTWDYKSLKIYVDGTLKAQVQVSSTIPDVTALMYQIGSEGSSNFLYAVIDEFRISDYARIDQEIINDFNMGITAYSINIEPQQVTMLQSWRKMVKIKAITNLGTTYIPTTFCTWASTDKNVASSDSGWIIAKNPGTATLTADYKGVKSSVIVEVKAPILQPTTEQIDSYLATPANGRIWEIPVVMINFIPTKDGTNTDQDIAVWSSTVQSLKDKINNEAIKTKYMLEEGSRFRGYKDSLAPPSLGYKVVKIITVYEEMPQYDLDPSPGVNGESQPDYFQILNRFDAKTLVETNNVKEFWINGYNHGNIIPVESNMSSLVTGDISNSKRIDDLPVYKKGYIVYNYDYNLSATDNVHSHGHQLEAMLDFVSQKGTDKTLFSKDFCGKKNDGSSIRNGRAGSVHYPPNADKEFDYANSNLLDSDIEDWSPNVGMKRKVNYKNWVDIPYLWPNNEKPDKSEAWWYLYWFQAMPGYGNNVRDGILYLSNWWIFTAKWDSCNTANMKLNSDRKSLIDQIVCNLKTPNDKSKGQDTVLNFSWASNTGGMLYEIQIATDDQFNNILKDEFIYNVNNKTIDGLPAKTTLLWRVKGTNNVMQGNFSSVFSFTTKEIFPGVSITGLSTVCKNEVQNYSTPIFADGNYLWSAEGGTIIGDSYKPNVQIKWTNDNSGKLKVIISNSKNQNKDSASLDINIIPLPGKPAITQNVNELISSAAEGNQWYLNGGPIQGATGQTFSASESGIYKVQVKGTNDCLSEMSEPFNFTYTGIEDKIVENQVNIFPNPADKTVLLEISGDISDGVSFSIYNELGLESIKDTFNSLPGNGKYSVETEGLPSGLYYIIINLKTHNIIKKFLIIH